MTATQLSAQDFFRSAYENRYTWDNSFPGYTADLTYHCDDKTYEGHVDVGSNLKSQITGIEDESAIKAIQNLMFEITIHRIRRTFEETHGANTFSYGEVDEKGAQEILMGGKAEGDRYKVHNDVVSMVHRHIHGIVVTINNFSIHDTGEGYLSHEYDSVYCDPATGEQKGGKSNFVDEYEKVGNYHLLNRRVVTTKGDKSQTQEFVFSNIQMK